MGEEAGYKIKEYDDRDKKLVHRGGFIKLVNILRMKDTKVLTVRGRVINTENSYWFGMGGTNVMHVFYLYR